MGAGTSTARVDVGLPRSDVGPTTDSAVNGTAPTIGMAAGSDCDVACTSPRGRRLRRAEHRNAVRRGEARSARSLHCADRSQRPLLHGRPDPQPARRTPRRGGRRLAPRGQGTRGPVLDTVGAPGRRDHNRSALPGKAQSPDSPATRCERSSAQLPPSISTSKRNCVSLPVSDIDAGVPTFTASVGSASTTQELSALLAR